MKLLVNPNMLKRIGLQVVTFIKHNTLKGIDRFGKPFQAYSRKPFAMPLSAFYEQTTQIQRKRLNKEGDLQIFRSKKTGGRWVVIDGGYANFKAMRFPQDGGRVNLSVRGNRGGMLGALGIIKTDENSVTIGFSREDAARLAYYHTVSGAGRSRVIRDFFGITPEQEQELYKLATKDISLEIDFAGKIKKFNLT